MQKELRVRSKSDSNKFQNILTLKDVDLGFQWGDDWFFEGDTIEVTTFNKVFHSPQGHFIKNVPQYTFIGTLSYKDYHWKIQFHHEPDFVLHDFDPSSWDSIKHHSVSKKV